MPRGGKRKGAGRKQGSIARATRAQKGTLAELAKALCPTALKTLHQVALKSESDSARVSAAVALLDRGYGKPVQAIEGRLTIDLDGLPEEEFNAAYDIARRITGRSD